MNLKTPVPKDWLRSIYHLVSNRKRRFSVRKGRWRGIYRVLRGGGVLWEMSATIALKPFLYHVPSIDANVRYCLRRYCTAAVGTPQPVGGASLLLIFTTDGCCFIRRALHIHTSVFSVSQTKIEFTHSLAHHTLRSVADTGKVGVGSGVGSQSWVLCATFPVFENGPEERRQKFWVRPQMYIRTAVDSRLR